jgi:hypothetical protein
VTQEDLYELWLKTDGEGGTFAVPKVYVLFKVYDATK